MDLIGKGKQSRESTCKKDRGGSGWLELPRLLPRMISLEDKNERIRPKRIYQYQTVTFLRSLKRRIYSETVEKGPSLTFRMNSFVVTFSLQIYFQNNSSRYSEKMRNVVNMFKSFIQGSGKREPWPNISLTIIPKE